MFREIVIPGAMMTQLRCHLLQDPHREQAAFILAGVQRLNGRLRLLGRELVLVPPEGFDVQGSTFLSIQDEFSRAILYRCLAEGLSLIEAHSHPFVTHDVTYSTVDTRNEALKFAYTASKIPGIAHATMVFGQESLDAHMWDVQQGSVVPVNRVRVLDAPLYDLIPTSVRRAQTATARQQVVIDNPARGNERMSRQTLAFGEEGQKRVADCLVGVVGCGGAGSVLVEQLAHLGVERFVLVDSDQVEVTNLNRLVGATPADVRRRRFKVTVMRRLIQRIQPEAQVYTQRRSVLTSQGLAALRNVDVIFGCVDNDAARLVLNRLAVQYLIPYIDVGTGLMAKTPGVLDSAGGQVRVVLPGSGYCLECVDGINRIRAAEDLLSPVEQSTRRVRGYGLGDDIPAPAVIFLNGVLVSLAVGEFLNLLTGYQSPHTFIHFDLLKMQTLPVQASRQTDCLCCSQEAFLALGDSEPLPGFQPKALPRTIPMPASDRLTVEEGNDGETNTAERQ